MPLGHMRCRISTVLQIPVDWHLGNMDNLTLQAWHYHHRYSTDALLHLYVLEHGQHYTLDRLDTIP